ncbi:MAG: hypothetical protein JNK01_13125, partial [Devosia sp.]|nr:hypothetical protein [Devosia sp.]
RGWNQFAARTLSLRDFGNRLAREWASVPVLSRQQGAHRTVERGESYYAGDGLNASLARASEAEAVLAEVLSALAPPAPTPGPVPAPAPAQPQPGLPARRGWLGWTILALLVAAGLVTAAFTLPLPF